MEGRVVVGHRGSECEVVWVGIMWRVILRVEGSRMPGFGRLRLRRHLNSNEIVLHVARLVDETNKRTEFTYIYETNDKSDTCGREKECLWAWCRNRREQELKTGEEGWRSAKAESSLKREIRGEQWALEGRVDPCGQPRLYEREGGETTTTGRCFRRQQRPYTPQLALFSDPALETIL